jgi:hypothetical protein
MTDVALKNPIVTAVMALKSGNDIVAVSTSAPLAVEVASGVFCPTMVSMVDADNVEFLLVYTTYPSGAIVSYQDFDGNIFTPTLPIQSISNKIATSVGTATSTSRSGTITTGGTSQTLMAANATRHGWSVQNLSTGDLWINLHGGTASAAQPCRRIAAGDMYVTQVGEANGNQLNIFGATTGQAYQAEEW